MDNNQQIEVPLGALSAEKDLLNNMYLSNVKKRLRALNQPSENDRKRWVWELIQNAKDSISKDNNKSSVDIEIEIKDNVVRFIHNGAPFTYKTRLALLYKYSEDKMGAESTGRFGTGFLTTHCLSKIVTIEGDVMDKNSVLGFSVTMYRDGQTDDELLAGIEKMIASQKWYEKAFGKTTFTYVIQTEDPGKDSLIKGMKNFYENIAQTLLFCPEIGKLSINDNGKKISIVRLKREVPLSTNITMSSFQICADSNNVRHFIKIHSSEQNTELTSKYKTPRNLRLELAVEVDDNKNIIYHKGHTQLYCALPLVGTEDQLTEPLYINCPDFEPDEERQRLLLSGNETIEVIPNDDDDQTRYVVASETGINRLIYKRIVKLYDAIVKYLSEAKYGNLYNLAIGLKGNKQYQDLDLDWFEAYVTNQYRRILTSYDVVKPLRENGCKKLSEVFVVKEKATLENELYLLMSSLFPTQMIDSSHNHNWAEVAWKELNIWNVEKLCEYISSLGNWNRIGLQGEELYRWYNSFLELVQEKGGDLLNNYTLLPDCTGLLHSFNDENLKQGEGITTLVMSILEGLGIDVKSILLDSNITAVQLGRIYNSTSFSVAIDEAVDSYLSSSNVIINEEFTKRLGKLISIVPSEKNPADAVFNTKRACIFKAIKELFVSEFTAYDNISCTEFTKQAWESLDTWLLKQIFNKIASLERLLSLPTGHDVIWLNNTLKGLVSYINVTELAKLKILPNQDGDFCTNNLLIDDKIPQELKSVEFVNLGAKITNRLLDNKIEASIFGITSKLTISDVSTLINQSLGKADTDIGKSVKEAAALNLIALLQKEKSKLTISDVSTLIDQLLGKANTDIEKSVKEAAASNLIALLQKEKSKLTISDASTLIDQLLGKADSVVGKSVKEAAALNLITLLPKEDSLSTLYKNQSELLEIAHTFLGEKVKTENKISINHNDETLWSRSNKIIVGLVLDVIRNSKNLETLQNILNLNETQTLSVLNKLYNYLNKCGISYQDDPIVPNQEGVFCAIEGMRTDLTNPINEAIKDISKSLADNDKLLYFRDILAHHGVNPQPTASIINPMTLVETRIIEIANQVSLWQDYKEPISRLFEEIYPEKEQLISNLPGLKSKYDSIMMNIVWNADDRRVMQGVRKRISKQMLHQLGSDSIDDVIQRIENVDKLQEENIKLQNDAINLQNEIARLKTELERFVLTSGIASSNPTIEDKMYFKEIRQKSEQYVYDMLKTQYGSDNVIWNNFERESYLPCDFLVKIPNGEIKYIECKGTPKDKQTFYMSQSEWFFYQDTKKKGESYEIYRVNNVEIAPELTIISNLDEWIEKKKIAPLLTSTETIEGGKVFMTILETDTV